VGGVLQTRCKQRIRPCAELDTVCEHVALTRSRSRKLVAGCLEGTREVQSRVFSFSLSFKVLESRRDVPVLTTGTAILPAARQERALQAARLSPICLSDGETIRRVDERPVSDILGNGFDVTENHGLRWTGGSRECKPHGAQPRFNLTGTGCCIKQVGILWAGGGSHS
jgi:hypothetical protein